MLVLARIEGEALTLSPSKDIDHNISVRGLFAGGPISIEVVETGG